MRRSFLLVGAGILAIAPGLSWSQPPPAHPTKPFLWKIESAELTKPSYLFGTIHLGSGPLATLHPAAEKAFASCEVLYTEIPMDAASQLGLVEKLVRDDEKTLEEAIGEKLSKQLDAELKRINPDLDASPFQQLKTWAVAVTLPMLEAQLKGEKAMDATLWNRAQEANKETTSIETAASQLGLFEAFTETEQVILLAETMRIMQEDRAAGKNRVKDLIAIYVAGDAEALKKEMDKGFEEMRNGKYKTLGERLCQKLLAERDVKMAATIGNKLAAHPDQIHFFAAGAAHFAGATSIRSHLEKQGYKVTRIAE